MSMADTVSYELIRSAIPLKLAREAAQEIVTSGQEFPSKIDKIKQYYPSPKCIEVKNDFIKNSDKSALAKLLAPKVVPQDPDSFHVGVFNSANTGKSSKGNADDVFVTIGLTDLNTITGWWILQRPPHQQTSTLALDSGSRDVTEEEVRAGDAIVWRADITCFPSPGGGGVFMTLVYKR